MTSRDVRTAERFRGEPEEYKPLEEYGVVGNLETVALVGRDGAVEWCCLPHLESPSVFARLLDGRQGGHFTVRPTAPYEAEQAYVERTNVLQTQFRTSRGRVTVTDFMPVPGETGPPGRRALYRRVTGEGGDVDLTAAFEPRFDYARTVPTVERTGQGIVARADGEAVFLSSSSDFGVGDGGARSALTLADGETRWFVLGYGTEVANRPDDHRDQFEAVVDYWRDWCHSCADESSCPVGGQWHDLAVRSGLVLKLLIHHETGAICAAPTTSLPEDPDGVRNWDYRYNWIRDSAFTVQALAALGHLEEARDYFEMCLEHCGQTGPSDMQPVYGRHGQRDLDERTLDHLSGYRESTPVRVGNEAATQRQFDVYGELVVGVHETVQYGADLLSDHWDLIRDVADHVCDVWREPDVGIWEVRGEPEHFVYSKVMCWAVLDRAVEFVAEMDVEGDAERWRGEREAIREAVLRRGYSEELGSFVRSFDADGRLDAATLRLPLVGFLPADDPRIQGTIDAVTDRLCTDEGLVERLEGDDGLPGKEGTFVVCSFWLVSALALAGRVEEAEERLEQVSRFVSPLGLLAEEIDPETGQQLGNFPQAFSHIGLVNSALSVEEHGANFDSTGAADTNSPNRRTNDRNA